MLGKRIAQALEIPPEVTTNIPLITMRGRDGLVIENHKRILGFTSEEIRILTHSGALAIRGMDLEIEYLRKDKLSVKGKITDVIYE